ncbi:MAG: hypothetical protein ACJAS1_002293 [Oleiphilaceae bacterium]|jgi:hypothetical protein
MSFKSEPKAIRRRVLGHSLVTVCRGSEAIT